VGHLCKASGITKGAFFHHFENKEALGVPAATYWAETTSAFEGDLAEFTCLVGTMTQEICGSHPGNP
jgi:TetR/AcrR family transcriptional repressor of nem operon